VPVPTPDSPYSLAHLGDAELLACTRSIVARSNQLHAALLAHLAEVEARGIHRQRLCTSIYTYCVYELRMSEDDAYRRVAAARIARRFPRLFDMIAAGELHLTGALLLGPHLTEQDQEELLARAKFRTKREILELVRRLDALPDVPPLVEPLGPAPRTTTIVPKSPTWEESSPRSARCASFAPESARATGKLRAPTTGAPRPRPPTPERNPTPNQNLNPIRRRSVTRSSSPQAKSTWICWSARGTCSRTRCRMARSSRCTCGRCKRW
jgi:hypothetical protein